MNKKIMGSNFFLFLNIFGRLELQGTVGGVDCELREVFGGVMEMVQLNEVCVVRVVLAIKEAFGS